MKKKIVILPLISLILLPIASFNIFAQTTYVDFPKGNDNILLFSQLDSGNRNYREWAKNPNNLDLRLTYISKPNYDCIPYFISLSQGTMNISGFLPYDTPSYSTKTLQPYLYNGVTYYYTKGDGIYHSSDPIIYGFDITPRYVSESGYADLEMAIRLTYGDLAENEPTYGEINNLKYYSNLITSNPAGNIDTIYWDGYQDTNGNDITGLKIEIKAESGYFTAEDRPSLLQETFANWIRDNKPSVNIYKGTTLQEKVAIEWQTIANQFKQNTETLGQFFWSIFAKEGWYYQYGWRYYARLIDENEEPISEWQELIQATSYNPTATETLTDNEPLTPDDVDTINDINNQNNTTNNWYVNNTVINNNEYNNTYQQNIIENIYNILQGTPDGNNQQLATDTQNTVDNAIDTEDNYTNQLQNQLNDLELNDISQNNGLIKALRWVREVHKETIEQTVFGEIVLTIMLIGLITYLIGRRNG